MKLEKKYNLPKIKRIDFDVQRGEVVYDVESEGRLRILESEIAKHGEIVAIYRELLNRWSPYAPYEIQAQVSQTK